MAKGECSVCELSKAAGAGDVAAVERYLAEGLDVAADSPCNQALAGAVRGAHAAVVRVLLFAGADPSRGRLLETAVEALDEQTARLLTTRGAQVSLPEMARRTDSPERIRLTLRLGVSVDQCCPETGRTALHEAAAAGHEQALLALLEAGARFDVLCPEGFTARETAERAGHARLAVVLREWLNQDSL